MLDLHFVLIYEGMRPHRSCRSHLRQLRNDPRAAIRGWSLPSNTMSVIEADLDRAIGQLKQKASALEVQLADSIRPQRLDKQAAFQFFRRLRYTQLLRWPV
jgi:hypothetical protein